MIPNASAKYDQTRVLYLQDRSLFSKLTMLDLYVYNWMRMPLLRYMMSTSQYTLSLAFSPETVRCVFPEKYHSICFIHFI